MNQKSAHLQDAPSSNPEPRSPPQAMTAEQYREVFDCTPTGIVVIDREYILIFANPQAIARLATPGLLGQNIFTLFPGNRQEPFYSNYRRTMEERTPSEFEAYQPEPLNAWLKVTAKPVSAGMIVFFDDITARKQIEALRLQTSRQLQQVFDVTNDAIVSLNPQWQITFLNRRASDILSIKGDLLGKVLWKEFPATADPASDYSIAYRRTMSERVACEFVAFYPEPLNRFFSIESRPSDDGIVLFFRDVTEQRKAAHAIESQQHLLATVQQSARMATWNLDPATGSLAFGAGSYPVFGHPPENLSTLDQFEAIILPAHRGRIRDAFHTALASNSLFTVDFQVTAAEDTPLWIEIRGQAIHHPDNAEAPPRLGGIAIDITARKHSEEALAASEERYRILADLNPQAIWMGAPDGSITYANQGFLDYIGLTTRDLNGAGWLAGFFVDDRPMVVDAWSRSIRTGVEYNVEARILRAADGAVRIWWLRALPVRDESGAILHWLGVAMDIHDARTSAEALHRKQLETERQRAELENIYQTASIGLALLSPDDFRFLRINSQQAEIFGLPPERIIGATLAELVPDIPGIVDIFRGVANGTPVRDLTVTGELPARPGEQRVWNVSYTPVYAADGSVEAITAASLEITNQKKAEAALIQSEKLAAVGRLASSISHEINNPLEAITNLLYLIATTDELPSQLRIYVDMAQSELSRVSQIATQTLRFHRQAVRPTHVRPGELVDDVLHLYQGRLNNSGIRVETAYATQNRILCFENDIRQVLNNLIANAIDAMRSGERLLARAHAAHHPRTGREGVRITLADTGHGMSPATLARVFEPFYTTKDLNGTGLGLWISAGIVQRHHGRLTVRSTEHPLHHGTVFSLFLPSDEIPTENPGEFDLARFSGA